jgi:hypothetical protein
MPKDYFNFELEDKSSDLPARATNSAPSREEEEAVLSTEQMQIISQSDYWDLVANPPTGSLLARMKGADRATNADLERKMKKHILEPLMGLFLNGDAPMLSYFVYYLVMPHPLAVQAAEETGKQVKEMNTLGAEMDILSAVTGIEMKTRADMQLLLKKIASRQTWLLSLFTRVQNG